MNRILTFFILILFSVSVFGADELRNYLEVQTRYWGIHEKITTSDLDQLVDLKKKADQPGLSQEERTKAYTNLFEFVQKLRGVPQGKVPAALAASYWTEGQSPVRPTLPSSKPVEVGSFTKRGKGAIPMILIPDIGADSSVFDSFVARNQSHFTLYSVTLPGFGGTNPPARQQKLDFGTMAWWKNAEDAILNSIASQKIDRPVILGHQGGSYLAMKLALDHPDLARGVVVLNGLLFASMSAIPDNATVAERVRVVNSWTPVELFPMPSKDKFVQLMMPFGSWFCKDKQRQESLTRLIAQSDTGVWWNYFAELATTNLSTDMKSLKVRMLVLPSVHDRESPGFESSKTTLDQWKPMDHSVSSLPITVTLIENCRAYATEDQPAKLDEIIRSWVVKNL